MQHAVGGGCRGRLCGIAPQVVEGLDEIAAVGDAPLLADPSAANQLQREFQDFEITLGSFSEISVTVLSNVNLSFIILPALIV